MKLLFISANRLMGELLSAQMKQHCEVRIVTPDQLSEAVQLLQEFKPRAVIIDTDASMTIAATILTEIRPWLNGATIAIGSAGDWSVTSLRSYMKHGATAFVDFREGWPEFVTATKAIVQSGAWLARRYHSEIVKVLADSPRKKTALEAIVETELTVREQEVLHALASGETVKEIASRLNLSWKTVEVHKANIMRKLKIHTSNELTKYAIAAGVIPIPTLDPVTLMQ